MTNDHSSTITVQPMDISLHPNPLKHPRDDHITIVEAISDGQSKTQNGTSDLPSKKRCTSPRPPGFQLQNKRCLSYKDLAPKQRCLACVRKQVDMCRFIDTRFLKNNNDATIETAFFHHKIKSPQYTFPTTYHSDITKRQLDIVLGTSARALLSIINEELQHHLQHSPYQRPCEAGVRPLCDMCLTTIFSGCWLCHQCGAEICLDCHRTKIPIKGLKRCTFNKVHTANEFVPITRHPLDQLQEIQQNMSAFLDEFKIDQTANIKGLTIIPESDTSLPYVKEDFRRLSDEQFASIWAKGEAVIVTGLQSRIKVAWSPQMMIEKYGQEEVYLTDGFAKKALQHAELSKELVECWVVDCISGKTKITTVRDFFTQFDPAVKRAAGEAWKLKDWPPSDSFAVAFPELYEDFEAFIPFSSVTHLKGPLNLANRFPQGFLKPDLGPKMYCAMASSDGPTGKGTTNLHLDIADAINVMVHAEKWESQEGPAVWDIFPASDAPKLRKFLLEYASGLEASQLPRYALEKQDGDKKSKPKIKATFDPIHAQCFYLNSEIRQKLRDEYGIKSWRIYQKPGEAVLVPAGCAHQVANLADCIKVACDFVSPQNVDRCMALSGEHRELLWKEDVLQLKNALWFTWLEGWARRTGTLPKYIKDWEAADIQNQREAPKYKLKPKIKAATVAEISWLKLVECLQAHNHHSAPDVERCLSPLSDAP